MDSRQNASVCRHACATRIERLSAAKSFLDGTKLSLVVGSPRNPNIWYKLLFRGYRDPAKTDLRTLSRLAFRADRPGFRPVARPADGASRESRNPTPPHDRRRRNAA